jgi:hypothetical protein
LEAIGFAVSVFFLVFFCLEASRVAPQGLRACRVLRVEATIPIILFSHCSWYKTLFSPLEDQSRRDPKTKREVLETGERRVLACTHMPLVTAPATTALAFRALRARRHSAPPTHIRAEGCPYFPPSPSCRSSPGLVSLLPMCASPLRLPHL